MEWVADCPQDESLESIWDRAHPGWKIWMLKGKPRWWAESIFGKFDLYLAGFSRSQIIKANQLIDANITYGEVEAMILEEMS